MIVVYVFDVCLFYFYMTPTNNTFRFKLDPIKYPKTIAFLQKHNHAIGDYVVENDFQVIYVGGNHKFQFKIPGHILFQTTKNLCSNNIQHQEIPIQYEEQQLEEKMDLNCAYRYMDFLFNPENYLKENDFWNDDYDDDVSDNNEIWNDNDTNSDDSIGNLIDNPTDDPNDELNDDINHLFLMTPKIENPFEETFFKTSKINLNLNGNDKLKNLMNQFERFMEGQIEKQIENK